MTSGTGQHLDGRPLGKFSGTADMDFDFDATQRSDVVEYKLKCIVIVSLSGSVSKQSEAGLKKPKLQLCKDGS